MENKKDYYDQLTPEQIQRGKEALEKQRQEALDAFLLLASKCEDETILKSQYQDMKEKHKFDPDTLLKITAAYRSAQRRLHSLAVCDFLSDVRFVWPIAEPSTTLVGRDEEIELLRESLLKKRMKNSILIGKAGCGKTAIVEQFASQYCDEYTVVSLDIASLLTNTKYRGEFENKFVHFMAKVKGFEKTFGTKRKLVVFIDEIHMIYGAGKTEGDILDLGNLLKGYLSRGEITIIGATTPEEYADTICKDKALNRRLSPIFIKELGKDAVLQILDQFANHTLSASLIDYIYMASQKVSDGCNPDISIEILDRLLARQKATGEAIDTNMVDTVVNYLLEASLEK